MSRSFDLRSRLAVPADAFWNAQTLATVNGELAPLYRMTAPRQWLQVPIAEWARHSGLPRSWILWLGLVPVDRHCFGSIDLSHPRRFVEDSTSWLNRRWRHERSVLPREGGCEVHDKVSFESRLPWLEPVQKVLYLQAFRRRHANLRRRHAGQAVCPGGPD